MNGYVPSTRDKVLAWLVCIIMVAMLFVEACWR
jgi:hypothetical protein